ncbi:uncharacterized protein N7473_007157 [Penicillium subrubescens]|uniref:uncharacterized protein n=1 Tax=Penicillium subrubescens TaxID=1316194 RepID=UPI002544FA7B|nr:uncharacterized protein N7473_007157 [Penicillium subrubescens]KAJ5890929.1 hypothetical protein N7473_007157 [Penicillium subrubescens]
MAAARDNSKPYIPVAGCADDGWSKEGQATATCYCGAVQLAFPTQGPGLIDTFTCHCTDCRKITASMFATNFIVADTHLKHLRGQETLKSFRESKTIASGKAMTNTFCSTCGSLMYRISEVFPGHSILRTGTVDDFTLHETKLKPRFELYTKDRVGWLRGAIDVAQVEGSVYSPKCTSPSAH